MTASRDHWPQLLTGVRKRHGWSQAVLADRLGVDQTTVSRWERRLDTPSLRMRRRIVDLHRRVAEPRQDQVVRMRVRNSLWPTTLLGRGAVFLEANTAAVAEAGLSLADLRGRSIYGAFGAQTDDVTEKWERAGIFDGALALAVTVNRLHTPETDEVVHIQTLDTPHFSGSGEIWCVSEVKRIDRARYEQLTVEFGGNTLAIPFDDV